MTTPLCPAQQKAFDHLLQVLPLFSVVGISGGYGAGKTTVLSEMRRHCGGDWLSIKEFIHTMRTCHPLALEETFEKLVDVALQQADCVLVDDLSLLVNVCQGGCGAYPRSGLLSAALECMTSLAETGNKKLIFTFFLIDGTCISGTQNFYGHIHHIFDEAKHNAPAIIFVDDSDVIFESGEELGLYRYLLTMLDGLESASAGQVCVMMTAMDVAHIPPALIRSGRIELWLEMRLPDDNARAAILESLFRGQATAFDGVEVPRLVEATAGFTGADLKRLVEDGKNLLAYDRVRGEPLRPVTEYFLRAVEAVNENKARYAEAETRARIQRPGRPVYFDQVGVDGAGYGVVQSTKFTYRDVDRDTGG